MRSHPAFIPELDFVAVADGRIVGNIVFVKGIIKADDGRTHEVLTLGPIAVLPEVQSRGIGKALIDHSREVARKMGFKAILLCGDPDYYSRHGFVSAQTLGIRTSENMYFTALQVCELYENALAEANGIYFEDKVYDIDENDVAEFDRTFPPKEKLEDTPSQLRFKQIIERKTLFLQT